MLGLTEEEESDFFGRVALEKYQRPANYGEHELILLDKEGKSGLLLNPAAKNTKRCCQRGKQRNGWPDQSMKKTILQIIKIMFKSDMIPDENKLSL